jgi:hypothetical protein
VEHTDVDPAVEGILYGVIYGTPVAALGAVIGAQIRSERWTRADWPRRDVRSSP